MLTKFDLGVSHLGRCECVSNPYTGRAIEQLKNTILCYSTSNCNSYNDTLYLITLYRYVVQGFLLLQNDDLQSNNGCDLLPSNNISGDFNTSIEFTNVCATWVSKLLAKVCKYL